MSQRNILGVMRWLAFVGIGSLSVFAFGQASVSGPDQFPQFRGYGGLPGNGMPILPNGLKGRGGATSISTPVGYSMQTWNFHFGGSVMSTNSGIPPFNGRSGGGEFFNGNGTIWMAGALKFDWWGTFTVTNVIVSGSGDNTTNYHLQFPKEGNTLAFAVGVQDITGEIGSAGDTFPVEDQRTSRSFYFVTTEQFWGGKGYVSAGWGSRRFQKGFANASYWVKDDVVVFAEHDGFNFNGGVGYSLGRFGKGFGNHDMVGHMSLGLIRGRHPFWTVGIGL